MNENGTPDSDTLHNRESPGPPQTHELPNAPSTTGRRRGTTANNLRNRNLLNQIGGRLEAVRQAVRKPPATNSSSSIATVTPDGNLDLLEENTTPDDNLKRDALKWARRRDIPLAIIAWTGVSFIVLWGAGHIARTISLLVVAALLAYALAPAVAFFERFMPRFLAMLLVYLVVLSGISTLSFFIVSAAVEQTRSLSQFITNLLSNSSENTMLSSLTHVLKPFGITLNQLSNLGQQLTGQLGGLVGGIVPFLTEFVNVILDILLVAILSIYLLADGSRVTTWLRQNTPRQQRRQVSFLLNTLQRIVGGYIRGQLLLCTLIGLLVGFGMTILHVPYALLLGVLAFVLEFIPVLGTLISGAICVLLALTQGWLIAVLVLAYFIVVHIIEGDIVGPRIVGKAIGLHPVVSLAALVAGAELFGIWGALFASPIAGVIQTVLVTIWSEWRGTHPQEFERAKDTALDKLEQNIADKSINPDQEESEVKERLLS
jgi:predicted PurR-regulated permease PerM